MYKLLPLFLSLLFSTACNHQHERPSTHNHLTIATADDPLSLDPRLVRDIPTITLMHMLYEGLMRSGPNNTLELAAAENVSVSEDFKTYTFTIRNNFWSDGSPVTASDFEQTWKSMLSPEFPAPNAYQLYVIKGAKAAKEEHQSADLIGIKALSPTTLVVELEHPTPYFKEMLSCHFFFPVHQSMREQHQETKEKAIGNGPFMQLEWKRRDEFTVGKNPSYWAADQVKLDKISLQVLDEQTALQLFKAKQLDWVGSPMSTLPQDAVAPLKEQGQLHILAGAGTHWFRFNTEMPPFDNEEIRRAFGAALDRQAIVDHVTQGNQRPAFGIIPPGFGIDYQPEYPDNAVAEAKKLFDQALKNMGISKEQLPKIVINYAANDRNNKIVQAVQQQWNRAFGIDIALASTEGKVLVSNMRSGNYQTALSSWYADIQDPINFLEVFKQKNTPTNQTFWQNSDYIALLDRSSQESGETRLQTLAEAEKILIHAMPVAPLFFASFNYLKNPKVQGVFFSPLGYLNFLHASKE